MHELVGKFAPTAIVVALMVYCCWCCLCVPQPEPVVLNEGDLPQINSALLSPVIQPVPDRNPFRPLEAVKMVSAKGKVPTTAGPGQEEPATQRSIAEVLSSLALNATYIQGNQRLAMIDGRVYRQGEPLAIPGESVTEPCVVARIAADKVLIRHRGQTVELKYRNHGGTTP